MAGISEEYIVLFNAVTKCIESMDKLKVNLIIAQQMAEQLYIDEADR